MLRMGMAKSGTPGAATEEYNEFTVVIHHCGLTYHHHLVQYEPGMADL
jgi:hypothetical protein